jgi:hypothetical protein
MMRAGRDKRSLRKDNRGATIVIVLVAMTLVTILGAVLLYLSLVNIQMKRTDREGKLNFYDAEAVTNEIRAGLQEAASFAISEAYTDYLIHYNNKPAVGEGLTPEEIEEAIKKAKQEEFAEQFRNALYSYEHNGRKLFTGLGQYDADVLKLFVTNPDGADILGNSPGDPAHGTVTEDTSGVTLQGIEVSYTKDGYETTIRTDIRISVPSLEAKGTTVMTQMLLPAYALIANQSLVQSAGGGGATVNGNAYAGAVALEGGGNSFYVQDADYFITPGNLTVTSGEAVFNAASALWAGGVDIINGGKLTLQGDAYVKNDLQLSGLPKSGSTDGSTAVLSGRYFGFGNSLDKAEESSSIIVNGRDTLLDMSSLKALTLAGHSFINVDGSSILMGESVSVKTNQLAYLVPPECLPGEANPMQVSGPPDLDSLRSQVNYKKPVIGQKLLENYISDVTFYIKDTGLKDTDGKTINYVYFYMKFSSAGKANEYFKDYFNANQETMMKYLDIYSNGISVGSTAINLEGHGVTYVEKNLLSLIEATRMAQAVGTIKTRFNNLRVTLTPNGAADGCTTPYQYYIDDEALPDLDVSIPKVIATNDGYEIDGTTDSSISLVIARGDVNVKSDFTGLIISGGTIYIGPGVTVTADSIAVKEALDALVDLSTPESDYKYFDPKHLRPTGNDGGDGEDGKYGRWDMENIVSYENWTKN